MKRTLLILCLLVGFSAGCKKFPWTKEEEKKEVLQDKLKEADGQVQLLAGLVESQTTPRNGFKRLEGLTDVDPWGHSIQVSYHQEWGDEVAVIRCAGPDGKFGTTDDLTRTRKAPNPSGILKGLPGWMWVVVVWLLAGLLAFLASAGVSHRRREKGLSGHKHPVAFAIIVILFAPLACLVLGIQCVGGALGASGDFFDGFD